MNDHTFQRLLDTYGADLERWPAGRRAQAGRALDQSPGARAARERAAALDRLLAEAAPQPNAERLERLVRTVVAAAEAPERAVPAGWFGRLWSPIGAVYAGLFVLGGVLGVVSRLPIADAPLDLLFSGNLLLPLGG